MRLTAKERILLYLLAVSRLDTAVEVPRELAQEGVAQGSRVDLRHLPQYLHPLTEAGLLRERHAHVKGVRQRRKVYTLTESGSAEAVRLRDRAGREPIQVRDAEGLRTMSVAKLLHAYPGRFRVPELAVLSAQGEPIDLAPVVRPPSTPSPESAEASTPVAWVEMLQETPKIENFVGRERELALITGDPDGPRVVLVRGIAGMGKSCLAAKACQLLHGKRNLLWHRIRPWDTRKSVLAHMGVFLSALGRPGLRSVLLRGESDPATEVLRDDLPGTQAFLVFDDAHEAGPEVMLLLKFLKEIAARGRDVRILICTRRALPGFGQKDVLQGSVRHVELEGLRRDEVARFLGGAHVPSDILVLCGKMGGHPLSVQLLQSAKDVGGLGQVRRSLRGLLEEEISRDLSDTERTMMKLASLYRVPVPSEALYAAPGLTHDVLASLAEKALLRPVGFDDWEAHDSIRAFFAEFLSPSERAALGSFAARELQFLAKAARTEGHAVAAVNFLSNALTVAPSEKERTETWEALGDANRVTGDLPAALMAYGKVAQTAEEAETVTRAHRKRAFLYLEWEQYPPAVEELDAAEAALPTGQGAERGWIEYGRADVRLNDEPSKVEEAAEHAEAAVREFRRRADPTGLARALCLRGRIAMFQSRDRQAFAEACFTEAMGLSEQIEDARFAAEAYVCLLELFAFVSPDPERAQHYATLIRSFPAALEDLWLGGYYRYYRGVVDLQLNADFEHAEQAFNELGRMCRRMYDPSGGIAADSGRAHVLYYQGRLDDASKLFDETWRTSRARGWLNFMPAVTCLWMSAMCRLRRGDLDGFQPLAEVSRAPDFRARLHRDVVIGQLLSGLDLWIRGDRRSAERILSAAAAAAEKTLRGRDMPYFYTAYFAPLAYACVLRATGRDAEADEHLKVMNEVVSAFHLLARRSSLPEEERQLTATFRRLLEREHPAARPPQRPVGAGANKGLLLRA